MPPMTKPDLKSVGIEKTATLRLVSSYREAGTFRTTPSVCSSSLSACQTPLGSSRAHVSVQGEIGAPRAQTSRDTCALVMQRALPCALIRDSHRASAALDDPRNDVEHALAGAERDVVGRAPARLMLSALTPPPIPSSVVANAPASLTAAIAASSASPPSSAAIRPATYASSIANPPSTPAQRIATSSALAALPRRPRPG